MDTSREYIKMCVKTKEIQKDEESPIGGIHSWFMWVINGNDYNKIWLPRQDQLQEMIFDSKNHSCIYYLYRFRNWIVEEKSIEGIEAQNWSMEQLWLAFVMKEKYNKTWNGEDWVCIKK